MSEAVIIIPIMVMGAIATGAVFALASDPPFAAKIKAKFNQPSHMTLLKTPQEQRAADERERQRQRNATVKGTPAPSAPPLPAYGIPVPPPAYGTPVPPPVYPPPAYGTPVPPPGYPPAPPAYGKPIAPLPPRPPPLSSAMRTQPASSAPLKQKYILDKDTKKSIIKAVEDAVELEKKQAKKDLTDSEINKIRNDVIKTELNKIFNGKKNVSPEEQNEILTNLINEIKGVVITKWLFAYDHLNPNRLKNILRNKVDGKRLNSIKEIYAKLNDWQLCFQGYDAEFKCSVANIKKRQTTNAKDPHFVTGIIYGLTDDEFDVVTKAMNPEKDSIRNRIEFAPNTFRIMNEKRSSYDNTFNDTVYTFIINENSKIVTKGMNKPPEGISNMKDYFFEPTKGREDTNQQGIGEKYLNEILEIVKLSRLETEHIPLKLTIFDSDFKPRYEITADYVYVNDHKWTPVTKGQSKAQGSTTPSTGQATPPQKKSVKVTQAQAAVAAAVAALKDDEGARAQAQAAKRKSAITPEEQAEIAKKLAIRTAAAKAAAQPPTKGSPKGQSRPPQKQDRRKSV
jgi:hypothetical protein